MKPPAEPAATVTLPKPKLPVVARIPIGAQMKMLGGTFHVTSASTKRLVIRGPLQRLKRGMVLNLFGVVAQVTLVGHSLARIHARLGSFDTRPILRIADAPEAKQSGMIDTTAVPPAPPLEVEGDNFVDRRKCIKKP